MWYEPYLAVMIIQWLSTQFYDQWSRFCLVAIGNCKWQLSQKGKKTCCTPAGKEDPVAHQQGKKTLLRTSRERRSYRACVLSDLVTRHRRCSIAGSANMHLKYLFSHHFFTFLKPLDQFWPNFILIQLLKQDREFVQMAMLNWLSCPYMVK